MQCPHIVYRKTRETTYLIDVQIFYVLCMFQILLD